MGGVAGAQKMAIFRQGRDGRALLVRPSRIPHRISKNIFALGAGEFLAMLESKIREAPSITDGVHRNENLVEIIQVFSSF